MCIRDRCAHVVQPVREFDQKHPHVLRDGEQQLAEIFALARLLGDEIQLVDLCQAFDQTADLLAEKLIDFLAGGAGVLNGVVQDLSLIHIFARR